MRDLALEVGITINFLSISEQDPVRYLLARNKLSLRTFKQNQHPDG
jgi:hypothetical protein